MPRQFLLLLVLLISSFTICAQNATNKPVSFFNSEKYLDLKLELYFDSLLAGGISERAQYDAVLTEYDHKKVDHVFHVQLSKRGHFRKFPDICDFPPLRIHFKDKEVKGTDFEGLNKIKIVTHCQNYDTAYEQYVIQEYLIYKAYNLLTEYSFKVQLARIRYVDLSHSFPDVITYTFFIENPGNLEKRLGGTCLDTKYIQPPALDQKQYALMVMFQYMMINQDWSVTLNHNVEIFAKQPDFKLLAIPFDFDMCGVIAIPYKSPAVPFKLGEKPQRNFMGNEIPKHYLIQAIDTLRNHMNDVIHVFNSSPLLTQANRKNIVNHITEFYDKISTIEDINSLSIKSGN
jgi:hypothetical protein